MSYDFDKRVRVAREMLEGRGLQVEDPSGNQLRTQCPGGDLHSSPSRPGEAVVFLEGAPTLHCFHASCAGVVADFNKALRQEVWKAEHDGAERGGRRVERQRSLPRAPEAKDRAADMRDFDRGPVERLLRGWRGRDPDVEWLRRRSPVDPKGVSAAEFLDGLYEEGDRVMVLTYYMSTGDFMWVAGGERRGRCFRLAKEPGVRAVPADRLPRAGRGGVHFLINPVSGEWKRKRVVSKNGLKVGRKLPSCVTRWRYVMLESDVLPVWEWIKVVALSPLRVAAIVSTGGKSAHVLARLPMDASTEAEWRMVRDDLWVRMSRLGADPQAMGVVNGLRLPGCLRVPEGHEGPLTGVPEQRLWYFDPAAAFGEIAKRGEVVR